MSTQQSVRILGVSVAPGCQYLSCPVISKSHEIQTDCSILKAKSLRITGVQVQLVTVANKMKIGVEMNIRGHDMHYITILRRVHFNSNARSDLINNYLGDRAQLGLIL